MGSAGDADEVAKLAPFLASDESSFISGSEFVIDGGLVTEATAKELRRKIRRRQRTDNDRAVQTRPLSRPSPPLTNSRSPLFAAFAVQK